jgi:hypothetical protein
LVDALASGASGGNSVEVRVLSWAPIVNEGRLSRRLSSFQGSAFPLSLWEKVARSDG